MEVKSSWRLSASVVTRTRAIRSSRSALQALLGGVVAVDDGPHGAEEGLGIVGRPPGDVEDDVEVSRLLAVAVGLFLFAEDLQVDAQLGPEALEILGEGLLGDAVAVVEEGHLERLALTAAEGAARLADPSGLVEEPSCRLEIEGVGLEVDVAVGDGAGQHGVGGAFDAVEDPLGEGLLVDGVLKGLANLPLGQGSLRRVEKEHSRRNGIGEGGDEALLPPEVLQRVGVDHVLAVDQVDLALLEGEDARLVVGNDADLDGPDGGFLSPVRFVADEGRLLIDDVVGQDVRARADVARHALFRRSLLHAPGRDEAHGTGDAQLGEHGEVGLLEADPERVLVDGVDALHEADHFQPAVALDVVQDGVEIGLGRRGVEGLPVGEGHAPAEMEGVDPAVVGDLPALGEPGLDAVRGDLHQGLVEEILGVELASVEVGIQIPDVAEVDVDEGLLLRRGRGGGQGENSQEKRCQDE